MSSKDKGAIVVDGAGGFIGGWAAEELHKAWFKVQATDLDSVDLSYLKELGIETRPSNLLDRASLDELLRGASAVVHCAAAFDLSLPLPTLMKINVEGTELLLRACQSAGIERVVHLSTSGVYGIPTAAPVYEDHRIKPVDAYSVSKAKAEEVVNKFKNQGMKITMFRPTNVYGPRGRYTAGVLFPALCILKERGLAIPRFKGGPPINMVHVEDVAGAIRFALEHEATAGEVYNMAETDIYPAGDFFDLIIDQFDLKTRGSLKMRTGLISIMGRIGMFMPASLTVGPVQAYLQREWNKIVEKYSLEPVLKPSLARDFMPFLIGGPHAYSNEKLRKAGYVLRHPSIKESFGEVVKWYRERRWIP